MLVLLVCVAPARAGHSRFAPDRAAAARAVRRVFPPRYRPLLTWTESRYELGVSNGANYGPLQINTEAHPWASPYWLTHSWLYTFRAAYRIALHHWHGAAYFDFGAWAPDCGI